MKPLPLWSTAGVFIEIGQNSLKLLDQGRGLELPLERLENGRLAPVSKAKVISELKAFLQPAALRRRHAVCALSARGVSLRRFSLPATHKEELEALLLLQMEGEFPLPPDSLAWGYCRLDQGAVANVSPVQEYVVAALKREMIEDYTEVLTQSGLAPLFTLAGVARAALCAQRPSTFAILDLGGSESEFVSFSQGGVGSARVLAWGDACLREQADRLTTLFPGKQAGQKLYITGQAPAPRQFVSALNGNGDPGWACEPVEVAPGTGRSAATLGLQQLWEHGEDLPLALRVKAEKGCGATVVRGPAHWRWAALALLLVIASLSLRYGEAFFWKGRLTRRLTQVNSRREGLPRIDREFGFLQYLHTNQAPFLDTFVVLAKAAPAGMRLDSTSLTRRGDLAIRGSLANPEQAGEFRAKLIQSGFFDTVVFDEQAPSADRQKITFRLTAQLKPESERAPVSLQTLGPSEKGGKTAPAESNAPPATASGRAHDASTAPRGTSK